MREPTPGRLSNNGVTGVTIRDLTVRDYAGANGNADAGIYAIDGNDDLLVGREHPRLAWGATRYERAGGRRDLEQRGEL